MFYLFIWLTALAAGGLNVWNRRRDLSRADAALVLLFYQILLGYGFYGLFGFVAQSILPEKTASGIGWAASPRFQWELGAFELGWGIAALLCAFIRNRYYWLGVAIPPTIMLPVASAGMIWDQVAKGVPPLQVLGLNLPDFGVPLTVAVLLWLHFRWSREEERAEDPTGVG